MAETSPVPVNASDIDPASVLSAEELQVLRLKFAQCNDSSHPTRALSTAQAVRLFRNDYPSLSEAEVYDMIRQCDLNHDGHLALDEYLQTRAYYRLMQEERTEHELLRCFSILDTDNDGMLRVDEVKQLFAQSGQPVVAVLVEAIVQAARETKRASSVPRTSRSMRLKQKRWAQAGKNTHAATTCRDGEVTFESFARTIRNVNRKMEQEIATKKLRMVLLQNELGTFGASVSGSSSPVRRHLSGFSTQPSSPTRVEQLAASSGAISLHIELEVLAKEIERIKRDLISGVQDSTLGQLCEVLVAAFHNEQHVYECLSNLIDYCGLRDPATLRHKLEQSGREVNVLDTLLLSPPEALQRTVAYKVMMDLSPPGNSKSSSFVNQSRCQHKSLSDAQTDESPTSTGALMTNATLRKQFAFYAMARNPLHFTSVSRSGFLRFVKDCALHELRSPALTDAELYRIFTLAAGPSKHMTYRQWTRACELLLHHVQPRQEPLTETEMEEWMYRHVLPRAKIISTQSLAPDVTQTHVVKLLREKMWTLKQIFCHFAKQSLTEVDNHVTLQLKEFLEFARVFGLVRASVDRDGEPFTPPPSYPSKGTIEPISFTQLMREYYAAKLDTSLSDWRDATDLTFREFLRCIERVAVAMHAHQSSKVSSAAHANGVHSTSFEPLKTDGITSAEHAESPLYKRRGNLLGASGSPTKNCKMTSTSIISILIKSSREIVKAKPIESSVLPSVPPQCRFISPRLGSVSYPPPKIVYGQASLAIKSLTPRTPDCTPRSQSPRSGRALVSPRTRPVTSGGASIVRVIHPPTM